MGKKKSLDLLRNRIKSKKGNSSTSDDTDLIRDREKEQVTERPFVVENNDQILRASKEQLLEIVKMMRGGLNIDDLTR